LFAAQDQAVNVRAAPSGEHSEPDNQKNPTAKKLTL
jgi:hypothetical protein